ncbi:MAG TPA: T9SS type A sorting domain-containing protein [Candidatus Kapabacteria bacterium]|nr:T9SS type A sorting domain-containing protein [Candidatus Kapabacteria bacterium]
MHLYTASVRGRWRYLLSALPALALLLLVSVQSLTAQGTNISLTLTKSVNATSPVPSGQPFTYTLAYSWSGGAPGTITITDPVPPELDVISTLPASSIAGNTVTFSLTGLTASAGAGTVQINARFKPGVTCNGTRACNTATIQLGQGQTISSNTVCLTASATNKWTFEKALVAGCAVDNDVVFRICVINPSGGDIGGLNLTNIILKDVLPPGAVVTSVSGWWSTFTQTGTSISFGGPGSTTLNVSPWNAWYCEYIHVTFPSPTFAQNQTVTNTASLTYKTPCDTVKGGVFSDTANVTLCAANPSGSLWKGLSINIYYPSNPYYYPSFTPGCCGSYTLSYYNSGNVAQPSFVMEDNLPTTLDVSAIRTNVQAAYTPVTLKVYCYSGGSCSAVPCTTVVYNTPGLQTLTTLPTNVCKVRWEYGQPIAITQSLVNYLDVCVRNASYAPPFTPVAVGQNIINTVTAQATNLSQITATHTKPVDSLRPKILATKLFMGSCGPSCSPLTAGPFVPGNIVRWRMAVANVGNIDALPCTITDLLPSGLTYVGNPTYAYGTVNWGVSIYTPPCCSLTTTVPTQIGGSITTPSVGDTNLVWTFPVLPHRCDGTVDYLTIEFDVKIGDNPPMPPGQYNNTFTFSAGNLTTPVTSNVATLTVNAIAQLTLLKEVRPKIPSGTFSSTATVPAGGPVEFRLRLKNTGNLTLTNICLLDIMPHIGDITVLPAYATRGSQFDLPVTAGPNVNAPAGYTVGFNSSANTRNPQRTTTCGGFCGVVDPGSGVGVGPVTAGTYGSFAGSTFSFTVSGGSTTLAPGGTLDVFVTANVPASAKVGNTACNSIAVQASPVGTTTCLSTQSVPACVTVKENTSPCKGFWLEGHADSCCHYHIILSNALGATASLQYNVLPPAGSTTPGAMVNNVQTLPCLPTSTVPPSLAGTTSGTLNFNTGCTGQSPLNLDIDASSTTASGEICIELIATIVSPATGQKVECRDTVCFRCNRAPQARCDSMSVKPFPFVDLDLSGRTFTIYNLKVPASPICSVKVSVTPPPGGPGVNGGGLYIDGVWKPWPFGTSVGYTQILPVHGMPANNTVQFNLGIDYTIGWVGNVNVTIYHCDGDSCTTQYGPWKATKKDVIPIGTPIDIQERAKLHAYRIAFPRDKAKGKNIRAIAIRHSDPVETIVAVTGASFPCDTAADCNDLYESIRVKERTILLELRHPLDDGIGGADATLTVLYTSSKDQKPSVEIVYYDDAGQELGHDSTVVTGITTGGGADVPEGIPGILGSLNAYPNPTTGRCDLGFTLPMAGTVDLELVDALGRTAATFITHERMEAGQYHRAVDLGTLANGSYLVTLRVNGVPTVLRLELLR